jgi:hypothetical protein
MPAVKSPAASANKWAERAGVAANDYKAGVQSPRRDWATATAEAADAQAAGVQQAISEGRFQKGVTDAGTGKWQQKAIAVGAVRFGPGVAAAKADYEAGFTPYAQVIQSVTLPPRGPKGDPRNYERTQMIGEALHNAKTGGA